MDYVYTMGYQDDDRVTTDSFLIKCTMQFRGGTIHWFQEKIIHPLLHYWLTTSPTLARTALKYANTEKWKKNKQKYIFIYLSHTHMHIGS